MDNFTNQDNNMQNTAGGNTYSYDYMNNAANTNGAYSQPQTAAQDYSQPQTAAQDYTQSQNVAQDYTQPGTYTGATAAWQAQKQAQQQANSYAQSYQNPYNAPMGGGYAPVKPKKPLIGIAITSMILGILSILCCCYSFAPLLKFVPITFAIASIIFGVIALVKDYAGKGMAIAGVICAGIYIVLVIIFYVMYFSGVAMAKDFMEGYMEGFTESMARNGYM